MSQTELKEGTAARACILEWSYCECGCKGHVANIAGKNYWLYNVDPHKGREFLLSRRHNDWGGSAAVGTFSSFQEADLAAAKDAKSGLEDLDEAVSDARKRLANV